MSSPATRGRWIVSSGAIVLVCSSLLQWWQIGGGPGQLPVRSGIGISDGRVFLMFLAAIACLLLVTLPFASKKPASIDHPFTYLGLFGVAVPGYVLSLVGLARQLLVPWPPLQGVGFWLSAVGLALLGSGVSELLKERRSGMEGPKASHGGAEEGAISEPDSADSEAEDASTSPLYVPDRVMRAWRRLARPSALPDRSASLDSEPRGRLDRLDIWVVAALIIVILSMRVYNLGQPTQMYFDEVYHARTAIEFLQDWRYNVPHDISEWTHPPFAKYAIAGGITLFSDYKAQSTNQLDVPVEDAVVQERTSTPPGSTVPVDPNAEIDYDTDYGDRVLLATGSEVRAYDLQTRALIHTYSIPGASALSDPSTSGLIYVGTSDGKVFSIDTNSLDDLRAGLIATVKPAVQLSVSASLSISHIFVDSPPYILVSDASGNVVAIDVTSGTGKIVGRGVVPGAEDFASFGAGPTIVTADPSQLSDATNEAQTLANLVGVDAAPVQTALGSSGGLEVVVPLGSLTADQIKSIRDEVASGGLPGITISEANPEVLVAYRDGVAVLDARHVVIDSTVATDSPATSIALNPDAIKRNLYRFYVAAGDSLLLLDMSTSSSSATVSLEGTQPLQKMPGAVTRVVFDEATKIAHVLGHTPDGKGWTVYAIETNGNAAFSDARLPFEPVAIGLDNAVQVRGLDSAIEMPDVDREALLAFGPDGSMASVDVGQFAFSWRVVGVLFGTLMAVCLYLLARILFRRRSVGLLIAFFSLVDGMLFAQSRIAMNDTYVGGFLLLGYLIFAVLWLRVWKNRFVFWLGMPLLGFVLGLALVSKWVALYAIASIGVLILIRSALGRLLAILGLATGSGVLGWMALAEMQYQPGTGNAPLSIILLAVAMAVAGMGTIRAIYTRLTPDKVFVWTATAIASGLLFAGALLASPGSLDNGAPNYTFFIIMLAITSGAAAANAYRPVAWTREELYFAIGAPAVLGLCGPFVLAALLVPIGFSFALGSVLKVAIEAAVAGVGAGVMAGAAFWVAGRYGLGPLARAPREGSHAALAGPPSPPPDGWLRLGSEYGIPAAWMTFCIAVLPLLVYIALYVPWSMPWQQQTDTTGPLPAIACWHADSTTGICDNAWPTAHTGQTLWDLTVGMYGYHNDLRLPHAASSPWWAWPLDLKPVWFDSGGHVPVMFSWIHDSGNPVLWWMAIVGIAFVSWQALRRRNLGLGLIAVAFFWQWLSWARIDRASFQYHFYTALPFFLLALAYFLAELWHGPSRRTWLLARVAAAAALLMPGTLWLLKPELCGLARVDSSGYFQNTVCGTGTGDVVVTTKVFLIGAVLIVSFATLALVLRRLERRGARGLEDRSWIAQLFAPVGIAFALIGWLGVDGPSGVLWDAAMSPDWLTLIWVVAGIALAYFALTARNPRRLVPGVCVIAALAFVFMYPDLSALWMPNAIQGIYSVLTPTWMYGFQFSTNLQASTPVKILSPESLAAVLVALFLAGVAAWAAWERRVLIGWRQAGLLPTGDSAVGSGSAGADASSDDADHPA